jgi:hypothetical protein
VDLSSLSAETRIGELVRGKLVAERACCLRIDDITDVGDDIIATAIRPDLANTF